MKLQIRLLNNEIKRLSGEKTFTIEEVEEELNKIIEERCENRNIYQYILKCLEYFKSKSTIFYSYLCNSIFDLLSTYHNFKFVCADSSYFSYSECELSIIQKDIEVGDYTTFIHEITHAIHGLQYSYNIPSEYEYLRNQLISNDNFMGLVYDLMRYIIQSKKAIIEQTIKKSQSSKGSITFEKINNELIIDANKINKELKNDTDKINKNIDSNTVIIKTIHTNAGCFDLPNKYSANFIFFILCTYK